MCDMGDINERRINFNDPDGSIITIGEHSDKIVAGEWKQIAEGVRYREWAYESVSKEIVDGALVEISPGYRTPLQLVESDHEFVENFQKGKFLVIHVDGQGDLTVYRYDSSIEEVSFSLDVHKGEFMSIYALKENSEPGEVIECETPGFISAELTIVEKGLTEVGGVLVPDKLRELLDALDSGQEDNLPVEVVDLASEIE